MSISAVLLSAAVFPLSAYAHHGEFSICGGESEYRVSLVYKRGLGVLSPTWHSKGWFNVKPYECVDIWKPNSDAIEGYLSVWKKNASGDFEPVRLTGAPGSRVDVSSDAFSYIEREFCVDPRAPFTDAGKLDELQDCGLGEQLASYTVKFWIPAIQEGSYISGYYIDLEP